MNVDKRETDDDKSSYKTNDKSSDGTSDKASEYIKKVCEQIRWKKAHNSISEELLNHIEDQKEAFIKKGQKEEAAEKNAVLEMGDAVTVGQQLDSTHRPKPDWGIMAIVGVCILISVALRYFISLNVGEDGLQSMAYFYYYLKVVPLGIAAMIVVYFADYSIIGKYPKILYGAVLVICLLLFNVAPQLNYVYIHVFYCALASIAMYGAVVYSQRGKGYLGLLYCGVVGIITCIAFGLRISLTCLFSINGAVILTMAINRDWFEIRKKYGLALVWGPVIFVTIAPVVLCFRRFKYMFITVGAEYSQSYVLKTIRGFLSNSKLFGQGEFPSFITQENLSSVDGRMIEGLLPYWNNDYCLTYMIHKFGWFVAVITIILIVYLMIKMFKIVHHQSSQLGYIVSLGVSMAILSECVIFLFANLGICGWISYPLPFISPGNISLIVNMGLMGLILSVYRNNSIVRDKIIEIKPAGELFNCKMGLYTLKIGKWQLSLRKR